MTRAPVPYDVLQAARGAFWGTLRARGVPDTLLPRLCWDALSAALRAAASDPEFASWYAAHTDRGRS